MRMDFLDAEIAGEQILNQFRKGIDLVISNTTDGSSPKLLLNFQDVDFMSSSAVGELLAGLKRIQGKEGKVRMANLAPSVREILLVTRVLQQIPSHDSIDDAIAHFN